MGKISVVLVTDYLTRKTGGPRFLFDVLYHLAQTRKYNVIVLTGYFDKELYYAQKVINIEELRVFSHDVGLTPHKQPLNALKFFIKSLNTIRNILNEQKDNILIHLNSHIPILLSYFIVQKYPIVCSIHHLETLFTVQGAIAKAGVLFLQNLFEINAPSTLIHVPSRHVKQNLIKKSIFNKDKIIVIPPGINFSKYSKVERYPKRGLFVMIGRLEPRKHYEHAIYSFKIAKKKRPKLELIIIGKGSLESKLKMLTKKLDLSDSVTFAGIVSEKEKIRILSQAEALIHLGYPEGFGIVIVEALALGVPVIAYDIPPINEIITNAVHGILIKKDDIFELAKVIETFSSKDFNIKDLKKRAKIYDINEIAKKFDLIYSSLIRSQ